MVNNEIEKKLNEILKEDLLTNYINAYGLTASISNKRPIDVNKPIVDSMVQMAKAIGAKSYKDALPNFESAKSHIKVGQIYCHNMTIMSYISSLEGMLHRGRRIIPKEYKIKFKILKREARLLVKDTRQLIKTNKQISCKDHIDLIGNLERLEESILKIKYIAKGRASLKARFKDSLKEYLSLIILAILSGYLINRFIL